MCSASLKLRWRYLIFSILYINALPIQVWTNLIHNGIQAMAGKGVLSIAVFAQDDALVTQITDSGGGIPPDVEARIFEPFFTTKPIGEGSGLGLHISQQIINKHQGRIEVASQPGQTTFSVWLPITLQAEDLQTTE
jgi:signal transduction histidine kinase